MASVRNPCVRGSSGGRITFQRFLAEFQDKGEVGAWRNNPRDTDADAGQVLRVLNRGGEIHTFTRVAAFGNGFVPDLNVGHGDPTVPVPECKPSKVAVIPAGGAARAVVGAGRVERYQCCIHPWMRTTVTVRPH